MSILDDVIAIRPKEEILRLKGVELSVPTEEQLAKARETASRNGTTVPAPRARLHLTWEPMSYEYKGPNGNVAHDFIDVSFGIDFEDLDKVRNSGWLGIPDTKLIRINEKLGAEAQAREWARWRLKTKDILHLDIDSNGAITSKVGQPFSRAVGRVFRVQEGMDTFPRNIQVNGEWKTADTPRSAFMRYPVEDVTDTYVRPETVPIRLPRTTATEASTDAGPAVSTTVGNDSIRRALVDSGFIGSNAIDFSTMSKQVNFLARHMEDTDATLVLGTAALNKAASDGELIDYLVKQGVVTVDDNGVIR